MNQEPVDTEQEAEVRVNNLTVETRINERQVKGDLFLTKEQQLENWCRSMKIFSKADIMRYGCDNFYIRADKTIRDMVRQGKVMRILSPTKMAVYRWCGAA